MWSPTSLIVNGKETQYPVPEPYLPLNFINSTGMRYEAEEVRQCLLKGEDQTNGQMKCRKNFTCVRLKNSYDYKDVMTNKCQMMTNLLVS